MKRHLQGAEQQESPSNLTKYCGCHEKWLSWLILVTHEMSSTMRGATGATLQHHQILPRPRKMILTIDHDWSASHMKHHLHYAEQQESPSNITKYCPGHEKWLSWLIRIAYEKSFTLRGATAFTKYCACREKWHSKIWDKFAENGWNLIYNARPIREWSEHDPRMNASVRNPPRNWSYFSRSPRAFCSERFSISRSGYHHSKFHQILRLPGKVTVEFRQILHLPRKMTLMIDPHHTWNVQYNARSNRSHPPTSPNIAPATKNDSHDWSSSHMQCPVQCAEQQESPSNITKYCPGHEKWLSWLIMIDPRHIWNVIYITRSNRSHSPTSPNTAPAMIDPLHIWNVIYIKRSNWTYSTFTKYWAYHAKSLSWFILVAYETSFTMSGATDVIVQSHQILRLTRKMALQNRREICGKQLKRDLQCRADPTMIRAWSDHDPTMNPSVRNPPRDRRRGHFLFSKIQHFALRLSVQISPNIPNFTKYCPCRQVTLELDQILRVPPKLSVEFHQIVHLPRKVTVATAPNFAPATECGSWTYQMHLPRTILWFYCSFSLLCFDPIILLVYSSLILLFFDSSILWLCYSLALLFLDSTILWLYYSLTLLFLHSTNLWYYYSWTLLILNSTILWLYYSLTLLFFESAFLWLYYSLTLLIFDPTMLCVYYSLTLLFFDSAILWLYFSLALLLLDSTILWLYYSFTLLIFDSTILWLY